MSVTPASNAQPSRAARLEFRVQLPAVMLGDALPLPAADGTAEPTRGLQVLNGILDKRSRGGLRRFARHARNRLWLVAAIGIALSSFALIFGLTFSGKSTRDANETDIVNDPYGDFEPESSDASLPPQIRPATPSPNSPTASVGADDRQSSSAVQTAVYHVTEPSGARTTWLDGTIVPDDSNEP